MCGGEFRKLLVPGCHLGTDSPVHLDTGLRPTGKLVAYSGIFRRTLGSLGEYFQRYVCPDLSFLQGFQEHAEVLHHHSVAANLPKQAKDFRVSDLPEYNHLSALRMKPLPGLPDAFLELEHHGAGTVNEVDSDALGIGICLRRFAVRPDQQGLVARVLHVAEPFLGDSDQTLFPEPFQLRFIVYYGTE